ncbi:MAG: RagB/SusD family nutrient uptake outer membrane protein [Sphingobacterium sp.]|jgi:hypothetical protein|nr:RagB/SusD family nutrient uptake outer membrane protein [Sphingobacterium sp.]
MNPINKNIAASFALMLFVTALGSCKKSFLEIEPKGKLIAQTIADYDLLLNNLRLLNMGTNGQVPMGDELVAVEPYFGNAALRTQRLFRWDDTIYEANDDAPEMTIPMTNLYLYNKIISEVPDIKEGTEQQKASLIAEARAGRAWIYFMLINYYGKPYNNTTSATDPGFPIITTSDVTATKFTRASVKEVYDFILTDLIASMPNLPAQTSSRVRMSHAAAAGILGKVYVFMGKFQEALPHLNTTIEEASKGTIPVNLYDYNITLGPGGSFLPITSRGASFPTVPNNQEILYGKQTSNFWQYNANEFVLSAQTSALYAAGDVRLKLYNKNAYNGKAYLPGLLRRAASSSAQIGVMISDIYLLRAECKARLGNLSGAKADLAFFRSKRMPADMAAVPESIAAQQFSMIQFVFDERIREYAAQGYRWFDMRRLSVDPLFSDLTYKHLRYDTDGTIQTFTLRPERLVLRFPQKIMDQNPGMQNNP